LRAEGRQACNSFLDVNARELGHRSTTDLDVLLAEC
jgi:NTE family protein